MRLFNKIMVPAIAAGLLMGFAGASNAQNFTFTDVFSQNTFTSGTSTFTVLNGSSVITTGAPTNVALGSSGETTTVGTGPNTFNTTFTNLFTLVDAASGQSRTATLNLSLIGMADGGPGGTSPSSTVGANFTGPTSYTFTFATGTYTLSNLASVAPGAQNATPGAFGGFVSFTPVPEPGSVAMLVGMGMTGAGFLIRRKRSK